MKIFIVGIICFIIGEICGFVLSSLMVAAFNRDSYSEYKSMENQNNSLNNSSDS